MKSIAIPLTWTVYAVFADSSGTKILFKDDNGAIIRYHNIESYESNIVYLN